MALKFYLWDRAAANNATADPAVNWAEGQLPSTVNDSGRAMMASAAAYRDDVAGAITTGGTSTAYTVTSFQVFDTLAHLNGQVIAFVPHTTNGATVTLNVDGLGAKPLRSAPSTELLAGMLVQGTPYTCTYNNSDGVFYLRDFFVNPYVIPVGGSLDYWGTTAPNSAFALMFGQAISRATYASLFSLFSTTYGVGDGSTTFNIPDLRGRVVAGKDDMGGSAASRLSGTSITTGGATTLGGSGGAETKTLVTGNLPAYTPAGSVSGSVTVTVGTSTVVQGGGASFTDMVPINTGNIGNSTSAATASFSGGTFTGTAQGGTSAAFAIVAPTIIGNKILRLI